MVGQRFRSYVESCGFDPEDVPKVIGTFVSVKYSTWAASVLLGIRCQPLRRLLLSRSQVLTGGSIAAMRPWAQLQRRWLLEACERTRRHHPPSSVFRRHGTVISGGPSTGIGGAKASARGRLTANLDEAFAAARNQYRRARARVHDVKGRFHTAGRKLLSKKQLQLMRLRERLKPGREQEETPVAQGWHAWFSSRYWQLSDKLEQAATSSRFCQFFSSNFRIDPQRIALGVAEGTILYKSTVWLHVPLQLWLVMHFFRQRRRSALLLDDDGRAKGAAAVAAAAAGPAAAG